MYDVLRATRRHVAAHAIVRRRVPRVAAEADRDDAGEPRIFFQRLMRIVAGAAGDPALDVAKALAQPIRVMVDLESLRARTSGLVDVDVQHVIGKRLAGTEGEIAALEPARTDHRHRRLQMTLKTDRVAQRRREPRRIDDGRAHFRVRLACRGQADVIRTRPVTALASRPLGHHRRKPLRREMSVRRIFGIRVVAEQTLAPHRSRDAVVIGAVIPRRHPPRPLLRIPRDGQLKQPAARRSIQIDARPMSRSDDPVDLLLDVIDPLPIRTDLPPPEQQLSILPNHLEPTLRRVMKEPRVPKVLDHHLGARTPHRLRHPDALIRRVLGRMAARAGAIGDVVARAEGGSGEREHYGE